MHKEKQLIKELLEEGSCLIDEDLKIFYERAVKKIKENYISKKEVRDILKKYDKFLLINGYTDDDIIYEDEEGVIEDFIKELKI